MDTRFEQVALRPGITMQQDPGGVTAHYRSHPILRIRGISPQLAAALTELSRSSGVFQALAEPSVWDEFQRLTPIARRCVLPAVRDGHTLLAVAESLRPDNERVESVALTGTDLVHVSKFAYTHTQADELLLESPATGLRIIATDDRVGAVVAAVSRPQTVAQISASNSSLSAGSTRALLELMHGTGFLEVAADPADPSSFPSLTDAVLRQWDFHDLLFHSRSRFGRTNEPFGGVFPYIGQIDSSAPVREHHAGTVVELPQPDFSEVLAHDPSLLLAMETRHSCRTFGDQPLTLEELSEFLFRTCRIKDVYGPRPGMPYQGTRRPYPTGGAAYELEVYLTVRRVAGLPAGSYHYEADTHRLRRLSTNQQLRQKLLDSAALSAGGELQPDALLTITSRFQRLQWKYRSIAYAASLKHVGVLYQTMYLVASAMKVGACGLGSGDSQLSVQAFKLDYLEESSVGEFVIGSAPAASRSLNPQLDSEHGDAYPGGDWGQRAAMHRAGRPD